MQRVAACVTGMLLTHVAAAFEVELGYAAGVRNPRFNPRTPDKRDLPRRVVPMYSKRTERTIDIELAPGLYFVTLEIGTPPRPFRVHLDSGSVDLFIPAVYTQCVSCDVHHDLAYDETRSRTGSVMSCSDPACATRRSEISSPNGLCMDQGCQGSQDWETRTVDNNCQVLAADSDGCIDCIAHDTCDGAGDGQCDDGSDSTVLKSCRTGTDEQDCHPERCCPTRCCEGHDPSGAGACGFATAYGDGSGVVGKFVNDQISFGTGKGKLGAQATFGLFTESHGMESGGPFEADSIDGIFGVAGPQIKSTIGNPVLDQILSDNNLPSLFGLCLGGLSGVSRSAMDLGEVDPDKYLGTLMNVEFNHNSDPGAYGFYEIAAPFRTEAVSFDILGEPTRTDLRLAPSSYAAGSVTIDSGTTAMMVSTKVFHALTVAIEHGALQTAIRETAANPCIEKGALGRDLCTFFSADDDFDPNEHYPTLRFWFTDTQGTEFSLDMKPTAYLGLVSSDPETLAEFPGQKLWNFGLVDGQTGETSTIFGGLWLQSYYTKFDRDNMQLGFAPVSTQCGHHVQGTSSDASWPIYGCIDENYAEYDLSANAADQAACKTLIVEGCIVRHPSIPTYLQTVLA